MDNFKIDVVSEGSSQLQRAIEIACSSHNKAVAYRIDKSRGMIFYWTSKDSSLKEGYCKLPYSFNAPTITSFVEGWLKEMPEIDWISFAGREPDHDGDNGRGFRVYNEAWGHIDNEWEAFVAVKPNWAWYGK